MILGLTAPVSAQGLAGDDANDYEDHANAMGYTVVADILPLGVCGHTDPAAKVIKVNPLNGCNWTATLAHEVAHVLWVTSPVKAGDKAKFRSAMEPNQHQSKDCSYGNDTGTVYENSLCELWAGAGALSLGQPHQRFSPGAHTINEGMRNQVSKEYMVKLYPVFACRIKKHYEIWLDRWPDSKGYAYWNDRVWRTGYNLDYIANSFAYSEEYGNGNIQNLSSWSFSGHMIRKAFERNPVSWNEQDFWRDYVNEHGRIQATRAILTSGRCTYINAPGEISSM